MIGLPLQRRLLVGVRNPYFGKVIGEFDDIIIVIKGNITRSLELYGQIIKRPMSSFGKRGSRIHNTQHNEEIDCGAFIFTISKDLVSH